MSRGAKCLFPSFVIPLLSVFASCSAVRAASAPTQSAGYQSTPELQVRVYSFAGLSPELLADAELEAARLLHGVPIRWRWVDCTSRTVSADCLFDPADTDLVVRVLPKALPSARPNALGMGGSRTGEALALLFYDRMLALRTQTSPLSSIVGRVLAHEMIHMLVPFGGHADSGLMRGHWNADDLRTGSTACLGLPRASIRLMEKEAQRRVRIAPIG